MPNEQKKRKRTADAVASPKEAKNCHPSSPSNDRELQIAPIAPNVGTPTNFSSQPAKSLLDLSQPSDHMIMGTINPNNPTFAYIMEIEREKHEERMRYLDQKELFYVLLNKNLH